MNCVELFAGAGGLALGVSRAGFNAKAVIEWNRYAYDTLCENKTRGVQPITTWPIFMADVREFDYSGIPTGIDLVAGGPPCQPFSLGGKHRAHNDQRDMFPAAIDVVKQLQPRAFMFENVKGLKRQAFKNYLEYIRLRLSFPEIELREGESWVDHLDRLTKYHNQGFHDGLCYKVNVRWANAADYGAPQKRERVFIVGFRTDLHVEWAFPSATHAEENLLWSQYRTGEYWEEHQVPKKKRPELSLRNRGKIEKLEVDLSGKERWLTVRDAISDLPEPTSSEDRQVTNHKFQPGARSYPGHTGSPLDEPAKALKAGVHGVPGGENMIRFADGSVRYFTVRESARLQCFPDEFVFSGAWSETMRQLGNAVPVRLAEAVATSVRASLETVSD